MEEYPCSLYRPISSQNIPGVVSEALQSHFGLDKLKYPELVVDHSKWKTSDWKNVAKVMNPYEKWDSKKLYVAFTHSHELAYLNYRSVGIAPRFGDKTNEFPKSIDVIDMYNICSLLNIPMAKDVTDYDMSYLIRKHFENDVMWKLKDTDIDKETVFTAFLRNISLKQFCDTLQPEQLVLPDIFGRYDNPRTNGEAVQTYFIDHGVYIGYSKSPLVEYYSRERNINAPYVCEWMREISENHKCRISHRKYFNINVPYVSYDEDSLYQLYCYEGQTSLTQAQLYIQKSDEELYLELQNIFSQKNFYHMSQPEVSGGETCGDMEKIDNVYPLSVVVYGKLCNSYYDYVKNNGVKAFTLKELIKMLNFKKNFSNPFDEEKEFTKHSVRKLKHIAKILLSRSDENLIYLSKSIFKLTKGVKLQPRELIFMNSLWENVCKYKSEKSISERPSNEEIYNIAKDMDGGVFLSYYNLPMALILEYLKEKEQIKELKKDAKVLLDTIEVVFSHTNYQKKEVVEWAGRVAVDETVKDLVRKALHEVMRIGMYCRGWKGGKREYVVAEPPKEKQVNLISMAKKLMKSIKIMDKIEEKLEDGSKVRNLPLFIHNGQTFEKSTDMFEGLTIGERVDILKEGEGTTKMSSCVRMTSNWLISSSYYYLLHMGEQPQFSIDFLTHTS